MERKGFSLVWWEVGLFPRRKTSIGRKKIRRTLEMC